MKQIYSKVEPDKILHIIHRLQDVVNRKDQRLDLIEENQFIQCSSLKMQKGTTFKPHRHIWKSGKQNTIAQESWCVIVGSVKGFFYDLDNTLLHTTNLYVGDVSFTLEGGHNYEILESNTIVYEYKTGPYEGQTLDKVFI
tara:strand:+ start:10799 stop:11218 length:420 start_codon:yes stop_codon:yes gene_type:complete